MTCSDQDIVFDEPYKPTARSIAFTRYMLPDGKKRIEWVERDGTPLEQARDVLDAVADAMTYLSLVAGSVGCDDLEELLARTFNMVSDRAGSAIRVLP